MLSASLNKTFLSLSQNSAISKWQYFHSELSWFIIYLKPFITTQETKLRWFQYRILHRITTNSFAYKLKLLDSEECTFCHKNNLLYITFVNVKLSRQFRNAFLNWLVESCNHIRNLKFSHELIIFGTPDNTTTDIIFNFLLLSAKYL